MLILSRINLVVKITFCCTDHPRERAPASSRRRCTSCICRPGRTFCWPDSRHTGCCPPYTCTWSPGILTMLLVKRWRHHQCLGWAGLAWWQPTPGALHTRHTQDHSIQTTNSHKTHLVRVDYAAEEGFAGVAAHAAVVEVGHGDVATHGAVYHRLAGAQVWCGGRAHRHRGVVVCLLAL